MQELIETAKDWKTSSEACLETHMDGAEGWRQDLPHHVPVTRAKSVEEAKLQRQLSSFYSQ